MNDKVLVEMSDGSLVLKYFEELRAEDRLVFDGPDSFNGLEAAQAELDAEIAAAGSLEAWKASSYL